MAARSVGTKTRSLIWDRDRYCCRRCGQLGEQIHHRLPRRMGGTRRRWVNQPANLVLLCARCHQWVELHRELAVEEGWLIPEGFGPEAIPIKTIHGSIWLDNEGGTRSVRWRKDTTRMFDERPW